MSAILSADDLNDFITPGVACIKPVETLPAEPDAANLYEVTTEDKVASAAPAQISLTDCLACSGCVTSAEAVLVSLQSHAEVLNTLDEHPSLDLDALVRPPSLPSNTHPRNDTLSPGKIFVATVSPQARANLAAAYGVTARAAGHMITQLLSGPQGLKSGGRHGSSFTWVLDSNAMREICLHATIAEALEGHTAARAKPVLASACPGWICYAEKTHPHILPHLSQLKSPQALTGTLVKTMLSSVYGIPPARIYHVAIMPCFDKKLEASRGELTDAAWAQSISSSSSSTPIRDVDTVITARELIMLASSRGLSFAHLPQSPLPQQPAFPDALTHHFLTSPSQHQPFKPQMDRDAGTSGGYALAVLRALQPQHPGSIIRSTRGRNADVVDFTLEQPSSPSSSSFPPTIIAKTARYYGFRNIQNLVRRLKPARASRLPGSQRRILPPPPSSSSSSNAAAPLADYAYIEVMACPGGCTNGGGQVKAGDLDEEQRGGVTEQKAYLARVDEAYFSASEEDSDSDEGEDQVPLTPQEFVAYWVHVTGVPAATLLYTTFRAVVSDVGKGAASAEMEMDVDGGAATTKKQSTVQRVAALAATAGGGW